MVNYNLPSTSGAAAASTTVTDMELLESVQNLSAAAEALVDAGASVERVNECMNNVQLALTAIQNGGVTDQMLKTFNGCGELSKLLGQENLTPAGLESFADAQIAKVTSVYEAGCEGKLAEYWNKFIAWLKNLWAKLVNWFKNLFVNRAKFVKALEPVKNMKDFDPEAKVTCKGLWTDKNNAKWAEIDANLDKALDEYTKARQDPAEYASLAEFIKNDLEKWEKKGRSTQGEKLLDLEAKERKVKTMFANLNQFKSTVADYVAQSKKNVFGNIAKKVDTNMKQLIAEAGKAGNLDGEAAKEAKDLVNAKRTYLMAILAGIRESNKLNQAMGAELYAIYKAANKAPSKK